MREETTKYTEGLPVQFRVLSIENYPLHWHNAIEIILVLEGSLIVEIGTGTYQIQKSEIEIVNPNEVHSLTKGEDDNLILMLQIDSDFFEQYYKGAKDVFFYADSSLPEIQQSQRYKTLREYIAVLFYEVLSQYENYEEETEQRLLTMMYYLLNNFHYLFYEEESLREDDLELERYHRIVRYITDNYKERVSLQEIAEQEFLTSQYLSYKIKNTFGHGFNDFLNHTRVEESIKLLLSTERNITEISEEVGFSHVRYYNRHFKIHYKMSPSEYRKLYKVSPKKLKELTKLQEYPLEKALPFFQTTLETYERYEYDDRIHQYEIALPKEAESFLDYGKVLSLGRAKEIYKHRNDPSILEKIKALSFEYALVEGLEEVFYNIEEKENINWHFADSILDYIYAAGLLPIFITDGFVAIVQEFKNYLTEYRRDIEVDEIQFVTSQQFYQKRTALNANVDIRNDTLALVGEVFEKNISKGHQVPHLIDAYQQGITVSDTFYGGKGLITSSGLLKPSYYSYRFLAMMGEEILYKEPGVLVTSSLGGFQVLLYATPEKEKRQSYIGQRKRFSINISNLEQDYQVTRYELNQDSGSVYEKWNYLGQPKILSKEYQCRLEEAAIPEIKFYYAKRSSVYNIFTTVKDRGATLYLFKKV